MKWTRSRVVDHNANYAAIVVPTLDEATDENQLQIVAAWLNVSNLAPRRVDAIRELTTSTEEATTGATSLAYDVAVLAFVGTGPFGLKVPILGPKEIFLEDDVTVDLDNADVVALVDIVVEFGCDRAGNALSSCVGGRRQGAGGP